MVLPPETGEVSGTLSRHLKSQEVGRISANLPVSQPQISTPKLKDIQARPVATLSGGQQTNIRAGKLPGAKGVISSSTQPYFNTKTIKYFSFNSFCRIRRDGEIPVF